MATINRDVFIAQFREEVNDHIQNITQRLFQLEEQPGNQTQLIEEIFRTAHTLKGSSRMMGYTDISDLSHKMEDLLVEIREGHLEMNTAITDLLFYCLDTINYLVEGVAKHVKRTADIEQFTRLFQAIIAGESIEVPQLQTQLIKAMSASNLAASPEPPSPEQLNETEERHYIRIHTHELDAILNLVGELIMNQYRYEGQRTAYSEMVHHLREHQHTITELQAIAQYDGWTSSAPLLSHIVERLEQSMDDITLQAKQLLKKNRTDGQQMHSTINKLQEHVINIRMVPASRIFHLFPRLVRMTSRRFGKKIELHLHGEDTKIDSRIIEEMRDPLIHLLQNAIHHGIEPPEKRQHSGKNPTGTITISAKQEGNRIIITVQDDGQGLNMTAIKDHALREGLLSHKDMKSVTEQELFDCLFQPGFSTSETVDDIAGRGFGLDIVRTHVDRVQGEIEVRSQPGKGSEFVLKLPLTLTIMKALLVRVSDDIFAIPTMTVETTFDITPEDIGWLGTTPTVGIDDVLLPVVELRPILHMPSYRKEQEQLEQVFYQERERKTVIVLRAEERRIAFLVDDLAEEREIVIKHLGPCLKRVRNVAGATTVRGNIVIILFVRDLVRSADAFLEGNALIESRFPKEQNASDVQSVSGTIRPRILLVDDSPNTREVERMILEQAGYDIVTAENGRQGLDLLEKLPIHLVITDIEMPVMDGLTLTDMIKRHKAFQDIPVIIVSTKGSDSEKQTGLKTGANAYIVKGEFDEHHLLHVVNSCLNK